MRRLFPIVMLLWGCWGSDDHHRGCDPGVPFDPVLGCLNDPGREITITLANVDAQPTHLFLGDETFPCCQVAAGGGRQLVGIHAVGGQYRATAGRNGAVIVGITCTITQVNFDQRRAGAAFTGTGWTCN